MNLTELVRDLSPPIVWRTASRLRRYSAQKAQLSRPQAFRYGEEQPPGFYDQTYREAGHWRNHYTRSRYYCLWTVIADRIGHAPVERILDIGCGPGQVACLLRDIAVKEYKGIDFSPARVSQARAICSEYEFYTDDVFESELLDTYEYDCITMLEFLEHVERDLDVLERIRPGTLVLGTVPNFPAVGHVRYFHTAKDVQLRYGAVLKGIDVTTVFADPRGKAYFIIQGVR